MSYKLPMNFQIEGKSFTRLKKIRPQKNYKYFQKTEDILIELKLYFSKLKYTKEILALTDKLLSQNKVTLVLTFLLIRNF